MIEKCPECKEKIDILQIQEPNPPSTTGTFTYDLTTLIDCGLSYPSTTKTYKCSNPKCWVTKITESWQ